MNTSQQHFVTYLLSADGYRSAAWSRLRISSCTLCIASKIDGCVLSVIAQPKRNHFCRLARPMTSCGVCLSVCHVRVLWQSKRLAYIYGQLLWNANNRIYPSSFPIYGTIFNDLEWIAIFNDHVTQISGARHDVECLRNGKRSRHCYLTE